MGVVLLSNVSGFVEISQVDEIAKIVIGILNGKAPISVIPPIGMRLMYWSILLTPVLLSWRNRHYITGRRVILTVILNVSVVIVMLGISRNIPFPLSSMLVFYPELGYAMIITSIVGIGWSIIYSALYLEARKRVHHDSSDVTAQSFEQGILH